MTAAADEKTSGGAAAFPVFNVQDFGAVGDGKKMNTAALQKTIDACAASGGGTVFLPPGRYLTGGLLLKSFVTLQFAPGAVLLGSTRLEDYSEHHPALDSISKGYVQHALLYGEDLDHIGIRGPGVIDGQGAEFNKQFGWEWKKRPYLIRLVNCRDISVSEVTLTSAAMWTLHLLACRRVDIDGVRVWGHVARSNDGFDIDACEDVAVSNCFIDADDDAIVLKSTLKRICRNITVTNCVLASSCYAFKLGTESLGGFQNVTLSNCVLQSPPGKKHLSGLPRGAGAVAIYMVDGGTLERVTLSNLAIDGPECGIFIRLGDRGLTLNANDPKPGAGILRDVSISHVVARNLGRTGCMISGIPGHDVENISLDDINMRFEGGGTPADAARQDAPEKEAGYPDAKMFGIPPAYGFYVRHAKNLRLRNFDLGIEKPDARPPFVFNDVERLEIAGCMAEIDSQAECLFRMKNVREAMIHGCRLSGAVKRIADLDDCRDLRWIANAFDAPR
jgi:polygalacturonase